MLIEFSEKLQLELFEEITINHTRVHQWTIINTQVSMAYSEAIKLYSNILC